MIASLVLAVSVSMTMAEFVELQKLSAPDLRTRFGLSPSCDPAVTALSTDLAVNRVSVAIDCRPTPTGTAPASAPGQRRPPAPPAGKGP